MLTDPIPKDDQKALIVRSEPIELAFTDDGASRLALVLPPYDDLHEIEKLTGSHFSLKAHADKTWERFQSAFAEELATLTVKAGRFGESTTFFTHLANLAELAGDRQQELSILDKAQAKAKDDAFFKHRRGENLQAQGRSAEAEQLFQSFDLKTDMWANLRLAYFHAQRNDMESATRAVSRVLILDPLSYPGRLFEGALHLARGDYHDAIQSFRIAEQERSTSSVLYTNLAIAYVCVKRDEKALTYLRKAVALDPLNHNAVSLLADVAHSANRDEDAVPALRYFVNLEQRVTSLWGRLARALMKIGRPAEALSALQRQASLEDTSAVWNNIGVARSAMGDRVRALEAYKYAMSKVTEETMPDAYLAMRNLLAALVRDKNYNDAIRFAKLAIQEDRAALTRKDKHISDIFVLLIHALRKSNQAESSVVLCEQLLGQDDVVENLRVFVVTQLLAAYGLNQKTLAKAVRLARDSKHLLKLSERIDEELLHSLANNLVFAFAEAGELNEARELMPYLNKMFHKDAYATATLGLIHIRSGNIEKAEKNYEEAIRLAVGSEDKRRIRQKLNLELGFLCLPTDKNKAQRFLTRVEQEREGSQELRDRAREILLTLRHMPNPT